jgi:hypothetical protein
MGSNKIGFYLPKDLFLKAYIHRWPKAYLMSILQMMDVRFQQFLKDITYLKKAYNIVVSKETLKDSSHKKERLQFFRALKRVYNPREKMDKKLEWIIKIWSELDVDDKPLFLEKLKEICELELPALQLLLTLFANNQEGGRLAPVLFDNLGGLRGELSKNTIQTLEDPSKTSRPFR